MGIPLMHVCYRFTKAKVTGYLGARIEVSKRMGQASIRSATSTDQILSAYLTNIKHRLQEFGTRLISELYNIEKKIESFADKLFTVANAVYEVVLPIIRR